MSDYERRTECGSCGSNAINTVLDLGDSPPANGDDDKSFPLQLGVCLSCSLLQQLTVLPDSRLFGGTYHFYSSASAPKVQYHSQLAEVLRTRHLVGKGEPNVIELACNDGDLLRHLRGPGVRNLGVEPAHGPAYTARERGLEVINAPFTTKLAEGILDDFGAADLLIANHVLAHIIDVNDFVRGVATLLAPRGVAVVEVQYAQDMIVGNQFDHVYHEHRYHYTEATLNDVFSRAGLYLIDVEWIEPQGGSIRATFSKYPFARTSQQDERLQRALKSEGWMRHPHAYRDLQGRANWVRDRLVQLIEDELSAGRVTAGYGATAKSVSLINFCGFTYSDIAYVVDTTPHKAGRTIPGTNIPIIAPDDVRVLPDTYVMWAWNYASYILRHEEQFTRTGRWIIPTPFPTVI